MENSVIISFTSKTCVVLCYFVDMNTITIGRACRDGKWGNSYHRNRKATRYTGKTWGKQGKTAKIIEKGGKLKAKLNIPF